MSEFDIKNLRDKLNISQKELAERVGVHTRTVQNWEAGHEIPNSKSAILRNLFQKVLPLTGDGVMLKSDEKLIESDNQLEGIPLIPLDAVAGFYPGIDTQGIELKNCDHYVVPEFERLGAEYIIRVGGNSMYPKYSNGDVLACKKIKEITFFQWGKVYVLDTQQGALVKRVFEHPDQDLLICSSDNKENYPPFNLPKSEIRSMSIVLGVIRIE